MKIVDRSKVRTQLIYDNYNTRRCFCSKLLIRKKEGPIESNIHGLNQWEKKGYMCRENFLVIKFSLEKFVCGDYIESHYYNHLGGMKE